MYDNILIPVAPDHSHDPAEALAVARRLASPGARITALSVCDSTPGYVAAEMPVALIEDTRTEVLQELRADFKAEADVEVKVMHGHAATTILQVAKDDGHDLIVVASHRPGLQDIFLGSTAARVVRHAQCCVHVLR
ncbi:universal stress protein [Rhodobacteraceae bacterium CCMM004]|nr:universal stress protein [Rhodobacteraceae bacterium CCMM004]